MDVQHRVSITKNAGQTLPLMSMQPRSEDLEQILAPA
jgi:hypothetical protein